MTKLADHLTVDRCPHCQVASPNINKAKILESILTSNTHDGRKRYWMVYICQTCGGAIIAGNWDGAGYSISEIYPRPRTLDESIPDPSRSYLMQAIECLHAPAGAIMLAASAIDAMLKSKGYRKGTLNARIDQAADEHLITQEMRAWAHDIRLDANDQRHVDENQPLPKLEQAQKCVEFACALTEFLYVLPSKVQRGREIATSQNDTENV